MVENQHGRRNSRHLANHVANVSKAALLSNVHGFMLTVASLKELVDAIL